MNGRALIGLTAGLLPPIADAHVTAAHPAGLAEGMAQMILGLEHLGALFALGLLGALAGPDAALRMQLAAPIGLAVGALTAGFSLGATDAAALGVCALLGLLAALAWPLPALLYPLLAFAAGAVHGLVAALAQPAVPTTALFAIGVAAAGALLYALIAWPGLELRAPWQRIALRVLGSWIAAIYLIALGASLRGP